MCMSVCVAGCVCACMCVFVHVCAWGCVDTCAASGTSCSSAAPCPCCPCTPWDAFGRTPSPGCFLLATHTCSDATLLRAWGPPPWPLGGHKSGGHAPGDSPRDRRQLCVPRGVLAVLGAEEQCTFPYLFPLRVNPLLPTQDPATLETTSADQSSLKGYRGMLI